MIKTLSACATLTMIAGTALASPPESLDYVPSNAAAVVAFSDLADTHRGVATIIDTFGAIAGEAAEPMSMIGALLETPGLDEDGSMALVIMPGEDGIVDLEEEPPMFLIVPVDDFDSFAAAMDAEDEGDIMTADFMGETIFMKSVGGGYAVVAPDPDLAANVNPRAGQLESHAERLGSVGVAVADTSDVVVVLDAAFVGPILVDAAIQMEDGLEMVAAMSPEAQGIEELSGFVIALAETFAEEGRSMTLGLDIQADGLSIDFATQFDEDSEIADFLQQTGDATDLLGDLPAMPVLAAMAIDTSSDQIKGAFEQFADMTAEFQPGGADMMGLDKIAEIMEYHDGAAFIIGEPRSLMFGAAFENTMQYSRSSRPDELMDAMREMLNESPAVEAEGITYSLQYEQGADEVNGLDVDEWGMTFEFDPGDPASQQMQMAFGAIFGPQGGPAGYYAETDNGVITTYSRSKRFLRDAISAATGEGDTMLDDDNLRMVTSKLPENPFFVGYIGVGQIMDQVNGMMAMFGQPLPVEIEPDMAPLALGIAFNEGGLHTRLFMPKAMLDMAADLAEVADEFAPGGDDGGFRPGF